MPTPSSVARTLASCSWTFPVAFAVRRNVNRCPSEALSKAPGDRRRASRLFSITASPKPVTIALCGTIPPVTPSKRSSDSPAGKLACRVSLTRAYPPSQPRFSGCKPRNGSRYTVTATLPGAGEVTICWAPAAWPPAISPISSASRRIARSVTRFEGRDADRLAVCWHGDMPQRLIVARLLRRHALGNHARIPGHAGLMEIDGHRGRPGVADDVAHLGAPMRDRPFDRSRLDRLAAPANPETLGGLPFVIRDGLAGRYDRANLDVECLTGREADVRPHGRMANLMLADELRISARVALIDADGSGRQGIAEPLVARAREAQHRVDTQWLRSGRQPAVAKFVAAMRRRAVNVEEADLLGLLVGDR